MAKKSEPEHLQDEKVTELRTKAKKAGIVDTSHMRKNELISALEDQQGNAKPDVSSHHQSKKHNEATIDAIALLKEDHAKVKKLFKKALEKEHNDKAIELIVKEIIVELQLHTEAEETIFYPAIKAKSQEEEYEEATDGILEAYVEHGSVKELIAKIEASDSSDESYKAMVQVMSELVEHHVEEEESEMFKQAKELLDEHEIQKLGAEIAEMKKVRTTALTEPRDTLASRKS